MGPVGCGDGCGLADQVSSPSLLAVMLMPVGTEGSGLLGSRREGRSCMGSEVDCGDGGGG